MRLITVRSFVSEWLRLSLLTATILTQGLTLQLISIESNL